MKKILFSCILSCLALSAHATIEPNGIEPNGLQLNGRETNGIQPNGLKQANNISQNDSLVKNRTKIKHNALEAIANQPIAK